MFSKWIDKYSLGIEPVSIDVFSNTTENTILKGGDKVLVDFARGNFAYSKKKGLDFIARFNRKYVLGETYLLPQLAVIRIIHFEMLLLH